MSPYRIEVFDRIRDRVIILIASTSKNDATRDTNVYILERGVPSNMRLMHDVIKKIAHKPIGRKNSQIVSRYVIYRDADDSQYRIGHVDCGADKTMILPSTYLLQSECQKAAMEHYISQHDWLSVLEEL